MITAPLSVALWDFWFASLPQLVAWDTRGILPSVSDRSRHEADIQASNLAWPLGHRGTVDSYSYRDYPTGRTFVLQTVFPMSDTAHSPDDSPFDLGIPTELESYQHQCLMLLDELHEAWADIRKLKGDTRTLVAMNDALTAELKALKAAQRRAH